MWPSHTQKLEELQADLCKQQEVSEELTGELMRAVPQDELKRLVSDLESQLETAQKAERLACLKVNQRDEELRNMKTVEEVSALAILSPLGQYKPGNKTK